MRLPLHGRTPAWLGTHSRGKPTQSIRCRHSPRRLRTREALGVRQLDGAVEERHPARRPPTPLLPSTNDRIFGRPEGIPLQARPHPSPQRNLSRSSQNPRRGASVEGIPPSEAVERVLPMLMVVQAVPSVASTSGVRWSCIRGRCFRMTKSPPGPSASCQLGACKRVSMFQGTAGSCRLACAGEGRAQCRPHTGGKPPQSMRCRDPETAPLNLRSAWLDRHVPLRASKRLTTVVTGIQLVPVGNFRFPLFPAKKNLAPFT